MRVSRSVTVWTFETLIFSAATTNGNVSESSTSGPVSLAGFAKVPGL